jgi:hypothetical protein
VLEGRRVLGPAREILEIENTNRAYEQVVSWNPSKKSDLLAAHRVLFWAAEARACDPSFWNVESQESECLELGGDGNGRFQVTNTCDEPVTLTADDCVGACPEAIEVAVGEAAILPLPESPENQQQVSFSSASGDAFVFAFHENVCPSEKGCALVGGRAADQARLGPWLLVLALGVWRSQGSRRKRSAMS